jgi:hypothetical protein
MLRFSRGDYAGNCVDADAVAVNISVISFRTLSENGVKYLQPNIYSSLIQ